MGWQIAKGNWRITSALNTVASDSLTDGGETLDATKLKIVEQYTTDFI
jgi:hypothetical protein